MNADLLIRGGHLYDPAAGIDRMGDIAVRDGHLVDPARQPVQAACELDAGGSYVFPGFIDLHTHLFCTGSAFGVNADLLFPHGVTTAVDMGSAGCAGFAAMEQSALAPRQMRTYAYLNVSPLGQIGYGINEPLQSALLQTPRTLALAATRRDVIRGLKLRVSRGIVGELGLAPLADALTLAERAGLPLCVHTTDPPESPGAIAAQLRPGDLFSHLYHGVGRTILDDQGRVLPELWQAKRRGVLFDVGNGRVNFNFAVAQAACQQGFWPDVITSDATPMTLNRTTAMKSLPYVMSKFLALGMPMEQVLSAVTSTPARILGQAELLGTLRPGAAADLVLCDLVEAEVPFADSQGARLTGHRLFAPRLTVTNGAVTHCQADFFF